MFPDPESFVPEFLGILGFFKHLVVELFVRPQVLVVVSQRQNRKAHRHDVSPSEHSAISPQLSARAYSIQLARSMAYGSLTAFALWHMACPLRSLYGR